MKTNVKIATAATAGRVSGRMTVRKMRQLPAPSMRAASSRSFGSPSKNCLKMKTAMAVGTCGRITAQNVP